MEIFKEEGIFKTLTSSIIIFTAISIALMVALIFSLFDRLSILTPIESSLTREIERLSEVTGNTADTITQMKKEFEDYQATMRAYNASMLGGFQNYDKYAISRNKFGINSVVGLEVNKSPNKPNVDISRLPFFIRLFESDVPRGGMICYLISFITDDQTYAEAIEKAVHRGVHVRLLLMRPTADTAPCLARWLDCYSQVDEYDSYEEFVGEIEGKYRKLWRLERKLKRLKGEKYGSFEILSYDSSLIVPMVIVKHNAQLSVADSVYTGFYTSSDSNDMPYIEWRGGDFRICQKFMDAFDRKWQNSRAYDPAEPQVKKLAATGSPEDEA